MEENIQNNVNVFKMLKHACVSTRPPSRPFLRLMSMDAVLTHSQGLCDNTVYKHKQSSHVWRMTGQNLPRETNVVSRRAASLSNRVMEPECTMQHTQGLSNHSYHEADHQIHRIDTYFFNIYSNTVLQSLRWHF